MNFNFGEVLTRAWQIIWKHKVLWIFGFLAGCGQNSGFRGNSGSGSSGGGGNGGFGQPNLPPQVMQFFQTVEENIRTIVIVGIALICVIWIITVFLSTIGRIGLIRGAFQAEQGAEKLIFGQLFSESMPYFWRMFLLSLIVGLPFLIVFAALIAGLVVFAISASGGNDTAGMGILAMMPLFIGCICLLIPVMIVVGLIIHQSERAIVLEELSVIPALSRGWDVFRNNLGPIILMAIILFVIGLVAGLVIAIPILIVVVPAAITFAFGQAQNWTPLILAGVCLCLYIPVSWVLNGILVSYTESAWTLTYMRLTQPQDNEPAPLVEANA
jgi:hypothetical protein